MWHSRVKKQTRPLDTLASALGLKILTKVRVNICPQKYWWWLKDDAFIC